MRIEEQNALIDTYNTKYQSLKHHFVAHS